MIVLDFIWDVVLVASGFLGYKWLNRNIPPAAAPQPYTKRAPDRPGPYLAKPIADVEFFDPDGKPLALLETELEVLICATGLTIRSKHVIIFRPTEDVMVASWQIWIGDHRLDVVLPETVLVPRDGQYKTWVEFPVNIIPGNDFRRGGDGGGPPDPDPDPVEPPGKLVKA